MAKIRPTHCSSEDLTICISCEKELPDTLFYKAFPYECINCVDTRQEEESSYKGYGSKWHDGHRINGGGYEPY